MQSRKKADNTSFLSVNTMTASLIFRACSLFLQGNHTPIVRHCLLFIPDFFHIGIHQMATEISINESFQP